ncbi:interleukin-36 receptor antagonist protein-like [Paroedura picta]|uniref:interleukin-36 receptor antagonist protein-like n=1 Tax=Paroedura picta TaxID=143630 RepID=UPI004055C593
MMMTSSDNSSFWDSSCDSEISQFTRRTEESVEMEPCKMDVYQKLSGLFHSHSAKLLSPRNISIRDINQQTISLLNNILLAVPHHASLPEHVIAVVPNPVLDSEKHPIFMGLQNGTEMLCCVKPYEGLPQLQLVREDIMDLYNKQEESLEFTFHLQGKESKTTYCFESAAFPGWFLSTSPEPNKPLGLSQQGGSDTILFYLKWK